LIHSIFPSKVRVSFFLTVTIKPPFTAVPHRPLYISVRRLSTAASPIRHSAFFWWFRNARSAHSVQEPSLCPARRFGTLYQTAWEIRFLAGSASDVCRRRIYLHSTEAFSVLEMFGDDMLYKLTYLLTYLLN